jgi:cell division protein FtsI/penicillin-binding protein 2
MKSHFITRIRLISICIFLFGLILIGKLYMLQIVDSDIYVQKADRQYLSSGGNVFDRGTIFFQNKDGSLLSAATLQSGFTVAINPGILKNPESVYTSLNAILPTDHDSFIAKATKPNDAYEEIATKVPNDVGQKISALNITGLNVYTDRWRFYPGGQTAAQTLGILGYQGDTLAGRYGLERQYDNVLGRNDDAYVNFFAQIFSDIGNAMASTSQNEGDIVTTIEPTVQQDLEQELATTSAKWNPDLIGAIIMNPTNGEIYAMASLPTFDPNDTGDIKDVSVFSNPLVEDSYEMGSIIKPMTIAAGLDTGVITATSTYFDPGYVMIDGVRIENFDDKYRGTVDMQTLLSQSLNVGAAHVESLVGNARFEQYMDAFGVNQKTGIDLPNEARNQINNLLHGHDVEYATMAFGQGISLTPIATVRALASIANGGVLVTPHVVKQINYKLGYSKTISYPTGPQAVSTATANQVAKMMTYSVDNVLDNGALKLANYSVAAKTGTAQVANPGGKGYSANVFLHSFVGFFPATKPQFFIFLFMLNPKGAQYSSETLTAPFGRLVNFLINYYEVPPER